MTKGSAPRQSHVVSLTGGSKSVKSRATFSYDRNGSLLKGVDHNYSRYLVRVNNDFKFNKYISANLDVNVKYTEGIAPAFSSVWSGIYNASELYAPIWSNGTLGDVKNGSNPYGKLVYGGNTKSTNLRAGGKAGLTITPIEGLKLQAIAAPNISFAKSKEFTNAVPFYYADDPNTIQGYLADYGTTNLTEGRSDSKEFTGQFLGNYAKKFGKHDLNVMLGYETYYFRHESMSAGTKDMTLDRYPYLSSANKELLTVTGTAYELAYRSLFGRLMYNFDDRYLLQVNFRRDGSSRFHKDYRWGNFPSVSLGWVLTEEKFMEKINHRTLSFLKIRGSWGRLGNERIGSNYYPYISLLDFSNSMYYPSQDATTPVFAQGAAQVQYAIRDISWETTESFDFGIDARFFDGRLSFTGDIYRKNTNGMLLSLDIPDYVGYTNPKQNAGKMHTTGWDIELGWNDRIGDVSYSVTFNMSDYRSKMGNLSGSFVDGTKVIMEGSYYNEWYGYISDGLFQDEKDLANSPKLTEAATQVGDVKFRDISGPDGIPDGKISPEYDRVLLGNSLPELMYGGTIAAQWNGFDLSMAFQGVGHQNVRMTESMIQPYRGKWGSIPEIIDGNYWSSLNTPEQNAAATYPRLTTTNKDSNNEMSTFWMFNGRYFRMKNITVGYTIPQKITRKFFVDRLRVYVSGNDLFSINDYPQGFDPERTVSNYPITKSVIFGLNVNF